MSSDSLTKSDVVFQDDPKKMFRVRDAEFRNALRNRILLKYFRSFCQAEYCVENLLFWLDVETYRTVPTQDEQLRLLLARRIYMTYITEDSPLPLNLGANMRYVLVFPSSCMVGKYAHVTEKSANQVACPRC